MPTLNLSLKDMEELVGRKLPRDKDELNEILQYVGGEVESIDGDAFQVEIKCGNRPDLWCAEGIATAVRGGLGIDPGLLKIDVKPSNVTVTVDKRTKPIRYYAACAIAKNVNVTEQLLIQLIQLQEKMNATYGRKRRVVGTGIYDFEKVKPPILWTVADPNKAKFVPLGFEKELTLKQILQQHPKGKEFGHLLEDAKAYPVFIDAKQRIMSMPPIINSNYSGKVTEEVKDLFIEATGTNWEATLASLNITVLALTMRGAEIYSVKMIYPEGAIVTPDFKTTIWKIGLSSINSRLGLNLKWKEAADLLERSRYGVEKVKVANWDFLDVEVPAYRVDVMHDVDIIEDVAVMYGYNNFEQEKLSLSTEGGLEPLTKFSDKIRILLIGTGAQEVQTFTLTDPAILTRKVCVQKKNLVSISNPMSATYSVLRDEIWPLLLDFLSKNKHAEYPQKIFEVGDVVVPNPRAENKSDTVKHAAFISAHGDANYTEAKQTVEALLRSIGLAAEIKETEHASFIPGRVGKIIVQGRPVGLVGEFHPQILNNFRIEVPVVGFEIDLSALQRQ